MEISHRRIFLANRHHQGGGVERRGETRGDIKQKKEGTGTNRGGDSDFFFFFKRRRRDNPEQLGWIISFRQRRV